MTSSSWFFENVAPIWTNTAFSSKSAARESTLRSDIQRHFCRERLSISCCALALIVAGGLAPLADAQDDCRPSRRQHSPNVESLILVFSLAWSGSQRIKRFGGG